MYMESIITVRNATQQENTPNDEISDNFSIFRSNENGKYTIESAARTT